MSEDKELCEGCGQDNALPKHTCPFKEEINQDESLCNCCQECADRCCEEI